MKLINTYNCEVHMWTVAMQGYFIALGLHGREKNWQLHVVT